MKTKTFNPSSFIHTAKQTWDLKEKYDKFLLDNPELAAPFHITGLEEILPKQYPSQTAVHFARSHEGKSTALRNAIFKSQKRIENTESAVAIISLEDTAETTATKFVARYKNDILKYQDDQLFFIGNSFGMSSGDMGQLNIDNIAETLEYGLKEHPNIKRYAHIFLDYAQIVPQSENAISRERRDQAFYATKKLFDMGKQFACPIDFASQALLKQSNTHYNGGKMRIPGAADLKEAGELYEIPHIAISYWMPKRQPDTPIGSLIEENNWSFRVKSNMIFIRIEKWRDCELQMDKTGKPFDVVGRIYPCWIQPDGEMVYDAEQHKHMVMKPMPQ